MPRTRSIAWSELKLGVVGVAALLLVVTLVVAVGGAGGFPWETYPLKTRFDDAMGLKSGAVVRLNGKDVGKVTSVEFAGTQIEVAMSVSKRMRPLLTNDAEAAIGSLSLLGEPIIDLKAAWTGTPIPDWGYVKAGTRGGGFNALTETASQSIEKLGGLVADVRAGRGSLGKLVTDDALYNEMHRFVASATTVTKSLEKGQGTIGGLLKDPAAFNDLKTSLETLKDITARINTGQGPLGRLLNDETMAESLSGTTGNLEQITGRLSRGEGTAGKLLTDEQLYARFQSLATRVDTLVGNLEAGRGTAGQLLQDQKLYETMNGAATELRSLLADIRKDPKKYLRVSVSIF